MPQPNSNTLFYISLLSASEMAEIEILRIGKIHDRELEVTSAMLDDFIRNFQANVYGTDLQVNLAHRREGEAAGWIKDLYRQENVLMAKVEWTPLGQEKIKSRQYRYTSSELQLKYPHHATGEIVANVLIGVALTNIPAVKGMREVTLSEEVKLDIIQFSMSKIKEMYDALAAKKAVTAKELAEFRAACDGYMEDAGVKRMLSALTGRVNNSEGEAPAETEKPAEGGEEKKEEPAPAEGEKETPEALSEKLNKKGYTVLNTETYQQLSQDAAKGKKAYEDLTKMQLSEQVKKEFCLSEERATGIRQTEASVAKITNFLFELSESQRKVFGEIMKEIVHVDLSERGATEGSKEANNLAEDKKIEEEAKKLSEESKRPYHECLAEIYGREEAKKQSSN